MVTIHLGGADLSCALEGPPNNSHGCQPVDTDMPIVLSQRP